MRQHFWKYFIIILIVALISFLVYNYYCYSKFQSLSDDVIQDISDILINFNGAVEKLQRSDPEQFILALKQTKELSNNYISKNRSILNNFFVKLNGLNGAIFPTITGDLLLWESNFNDKITFLEEDIQYLLNKGIFLASIGKNNELDKHFISIKKTVFDINKLLNDGEILLKKAEARNQLTLKHQTSSTLLIDQNNSFSDGVTVIKVSQDKILNVNHFLNIVEYFFGINEGKKFLVILQNPEQLSATGGNWVLYGLLDCQNALCHLTNIDFVTNLNIAMLDKLVPPDELRFSNDIWVFEDLNWFFNFPTSSSLALKYYPQKLSFNGLIALNIPVIERLLNITGPVHISLEGEDIDISANNFSAFITDLQKIVRQNKSSNENQQINTFFTTLNNLLSEKAADNNTMLQFTNILFKALATKEIQLYSTNSSCEEDLDAFNWSGKMRGSKIKNTDYLATIITNTDKKGIDQNIKTDVTLNVNINKDGSILNTLDINISNNNSAKVKDKGYYYLRVYLPLNSEILKIKSPSVRGTPPKTTDSFLKKGFTYDKSLETIDMKTIYLDKEDAKLFIENGYLGVGAWAILKSGEKKTLEISYRLPFKIDFKNNPSYSLYLQKQSAVSNKVDIDVIYPATSNPGVSNTIHKTINLDRDLIAEFSLE